MVDPNKDQDWIIVIDWIIMVDPIEIDDAFLVENFNFYMTQSKIATILLNFYFVSTRYYLIN